MKATARQITADLLEQLRQRHGGNEWAFVTEVPDSTGGPAQRSADAIAMNLWPSRGLELHGFEIKAARGDWLKELKTPEKAEAIAQFCDRWWIVAPKGLVNKDELPPTWGLLESPGKTLRPTVQAPKLDCTPADRPFIAALIRRATEQLTDDKAIQAATRQARKQGFANGEESAQRSVERAERSLSDYKESLKKFEDRSGIEIREWSMGRVGDAVKAYAEMTRNGKRLVDQLDRQREMYEEGLENVKNLIKSAGPQ